MKSFVKVFNYSSKASEGAVKTHKVFIMSETEDHIQGFDLDKLTPSEIRVLKRTLKNHEIKNTFFSKTNPSTAKTTKSLSDLTRKAWRSYKKESFAYDVLTKQQLVEQLTNETKRSSTAVRANVNAVLRGKNRKTAYGHKIVKIEMNQFRVI